MKFKIIIGTTERNDYEFETMYDEEIMVIPDKFATPLLKNFIAKYDKNSENIYKTLKIELLITKTNAL